MSNLMCSAYLLATEPLFRIACAVDLESALAKRGLTLDEAEFKAFSQLWTMISHSMGDGESFPIEWPNPDPWT